MFRKAGVVVVAGLIAAAAVRLVNPGERRFEPGDRAFERAVGGATPSGRVLDRALVRLSGISRRQAGRVVVELVDERAEARVGVDRGELRQVRANRDGELVIGLPERSTPGATVELVAVSAPLRLRAIVVASPVSWWPAALAFVAAVLSLASLLGKASPRDVFAFGVTLAALLSIPLMTTLTMLTTRGWVPLALVVLGVVIGCRSRFFWAASGLAASLILGIWVRFYFLPSDGSWDTEYWKAWMSRAVTAGTPYVYGDADAVGDGEFFDQLLGRSELWRATYQGREFVVDYPPGAMALWRWSSIAVSRVAPGLERGEAENVAVKLPSVLGDIAAVALLLWIFRRERALGLTLAALYWASPLSWLSSGVLGFLDGAYAPLAVGALVAAAAGRAGWSGVLIALAALIKPQALIVVPAAVVALIRAEVSVRPAVLWGLAVVGASLAPFVIAGTLDEAVTHVFRILFQQRLSAGYANPWWLVGRVVSDEPFATKNLIPLSGAIAAAAFAVSAFFVASRAKGAFLAGGGLIFAYAMFALGVHHNHPHVMFLAFAAGGIRHRRDAVLAGALATSYVLNMVCLSGLGRFYGTRYMGIEPLIASAARLRTALGFDLTLLLAVANTVIFALFVAHLQRRDAPSHDP